MAQVISIAPDGSILSLQHKRGQGIDLRPLGRASIERITLIEWSEEKQAWFIEWTDPSRGVDGQAKWDAETFEAAKLRAGDLGGFYHPSAEPDEYPEWCVFFEDYEDANAAEVAVVQALQLAGKYTRTPQAVA